MLLKEKTTDVNVTDNEDRTNLHWWARVSEKNPDDKERLENCFNLILEKGVKRIKVLLKFQLDVFYLFICRFYMFRATPIFRSFKCTLQTIGVCTLWKAELNIIKLCGAM